MCFVLYLGYRVLFVAGKVVCGSGKVYFYVSGKGVVGTA